MEEKNKIEAEEEPCTVEAEGDIEELSAKAESYDIIEADYRRLKDIAERNGCDVGGMISSIERSAAESRRARLSERCPDGELVEHILSLEAERGVGARSDFEELKEMFPEIGDVSQLPPSVVKAAQLRGSTLLDEYLRYSLRLRRMRDAAEEAEKRAAASSIGSQRNSSSNEIDPSSAEFIKAIWGR